MQIIGIDLGTTNSVVCVKEGSDTTIITNRQGNRTTPSYITIKDKEILYGEISKNNALNEPKNTISSIKRLIGLRKSEYTEKLKHIINLLTNAQKLPSKNKDHQLKGVSKDCRECHIEPDWLLIYMLHNPHVTFVRTGSHSDLFK